MINRILNLPDLLKKKSFFLFGPRATGKTFLIRQSFSKETPIINLLRSDIYLRLNAAPYELESIIDSYATTDLVVIDEIQRVPELLNEVHRLIEERNIIFLLTGSSARKLKNDGVNLLAGRAWEANLFPLTSMEIPNFNLNHYLHYGGLPPVYLSNEPLEELDAYVNTYLKEEIQAESLVRKIPAFTRFLQIAALTSGKMMNFSSLASDTGVSLATIREYYHILEDTFLGFMVHGWTKSVKRKAIQTAKFYLFDLGVKNTLAQINTLDEKSDLYGQSFEHFIALELRAYLSYRRIKKEMCYWCTKHGIEVDFIIGDDVAIEVKTTRVVHDKHIKSLKTLQEEGIAKRFILISFDKVNRTDQNIEMLYWEDFLRALWQDQIL